MMEWQLVVSSVAGLVAMEWSYVIMLKSNRTKDDVMKEWMGIKWCALGTGGIAFAGAFLIMQFSMVAITIGALLALFGGNYLVARAIAKGMPKSKSKRR